MMSLVNMSSDSPVLTSTIYFSYNQFFVFDASIKLPACAWTQAHVDQGFARREHNAAFGTLLEFGRGELLAFLGPYVPREHHERAIEVPLEVSSGSVVVAGPDEFDDNRTVALPRGHYRLTVAQTVLADDAEKIELFFEQSAQPVRGSRVLVADPTLHPPSPLVETADEVGT